VTQDPLSQGARLYTRVSLDGVVLS
jgi:hypothetical protein